MPITERSLLTPVRSALGANPAALESDASLHSELNRLVGSGTPWRVAVRTLIPDGAVDFAAEFLDEAAANWIWLAEPLERERALDLGSRLGRVAAALSPHFTHVLFQAHSAPAARFARLRFAEDGLNRIAVAEAPRGAYPYPPAAFDCIAVSHLALAGLHGGALQRELTCWRGLLRVGGCLCVEFDNRGWLGRYLRWRDGSGASAQPAQPPARFARRLARAGFRGIRVYYVELTHGRVRSIIPRSRTAVQTWGRQASGSRRSRALRSLVARLGIHTLLFRSCIALAYR